MYMWSWLHQEVLLRVKRPLSAGEYYYRWHAACLSPLSFRCSHRRRFTPLVLHVCLFIVTEATSGKKTLFSKAGFCVEVCEVLSETVAEFVKQQDIYTHLHRTGGGIWTSTLATVLTTHMETDRNNTHDNNNCNKACFLKRGSGEVSLRPTESSTGWLLRHTCR